jgi:hypothetical protein
VAERLIIELSGASADSPKQVVRELAWKRQYQSGDTISGGHGDPLSALYDFARGLSESARLVRNAQAAERGMKAAREHRSTVSEDYQQAMQVYRDVYARLLGIQVEQLLALGPGDERHATDPAMPDGESTAGVTDAAVRERIIAEKLVREAMIPYEQAEARADRHRTVRWAMYQLVGSLVVGLVVLAIVIWVLSLK